MNTTKPLALEIDVFDHIISKIAESGESSSAYLRRRLGFGRPTIAIAAPPPPAPGTPSVSARLDELFSSAEFGNARGVVGRFLVLLSWLYRQHTAQFDTVRTIKGRGRLYFAKSKAELTAAGKSVNPKEIPGSPYWVITTSPTILKQEMIRAAMFAFGYAMPDIMRAENQIAGSERQRILDSI